MFSNQEIKLLAEENGFDPAVLHYLNVRFQGISISGEDNPPKYLNIPNVQFGKYPTFKGVIDKDIYFFAPQMTSQETPYSFDPDKHTLSYQNKSISNLREVIDEKRYGSLKNQNWYFKARYWEVPEESDVVKAEELLDTSYLTLNLIDFCNEFCEHCWRTYKEKARYHKECGEDPKDRIMTVDTVISQIEDAFGENTLENVEKVTLMEGGFNPRLLRPEMYPESVRDSLGKFNEKELYKLHLKNVKEKLEEHGFEGNINTFSFKLDEEMIQFLVEEEFDTSEYCLPLESFTRRDEYMRHDRKGRPFEEYLPYLEYAKKYYDDTKVFILLGLKDNLKDLEEHLSVLKEMNVLPQVGLYSVNSPRQEELVCEDLQGMEYLDFVLKSMKILKEKGFPIFSETGRNNGLLPPHFKKYINENLDISDKNK